MRSALTEQDAVTVTGPEADFLQLGPTPCRCLIAVQDPAMCQDDELGLHPRGPVDVAVELIDFERLELS